MDAPDAARQSFTRVIATGHFTRPTRQPSLPRLHRIK
jgi:hypothetical protein